MTAEMSAPRGAFTDRQVDQLLAPIKPHRVFVAQNQAHLAGWDVYAHLSRMFGFGGWDKEILDLGLVFESEAEYVKDGKPKVGWTVCYRCRIRLTIYDPSGRLVTFKDGAATGTANNLPKRGDAHDFAMKNSVTYAVKVAAKDLGDQFGLSLYRKGSKEAVVRSTLVGGPDEALQDTPAPTSIDDDHGEPGADLDPDGPVEPVGETVPVARAKQEILAACGGDAVAAKAVWDQAVADKLVVAKPTVVERDVVDQILARVTPDPTLIAEVAGLVTHALADANLKPEFERFLLDNDIPPVEPDQWTTRQLTEVHGWLSV